jgi:parvulin-like peptidyl-prolyl isomerase
MRSLLAILAALAVALPAAPTALLDRVVAQVNGVAILQSEVDEALGPNLEGAPPRVRRLDWAEARDRLIDNLLLEQEARRLGLEAPEERIAEAVDERVEELIASWPDQSSFEAMVVSQGETLASLRERLRERETRSWLRRNIVIARMAGPPEVIDLSARVGLSQIVIACEPRAPESLVNAANLEALAVREEILSGAQTFEEAALSRSADRDTAARGGSLGMMEWDALSPRIAEALEGLGEGEVSRPVRTRQGWHLFRVEQRITPRERWTMNEFERAHEALVAELRERETVRVFGEEGE